MAGPIRKHICNNPPFPWLDWIIDGQKEYEGRLFRGDWATMIIGQKIEFYDDHGKCFAVRVDGIKRFKDFDQAYNALGSKLIPDLGVYTTANQLYTQLVGFRQEDIDNYGVIALKVISC